MSNLAEETALAFRPSSYEGKPRHLDRGQAKLLDSFAEEAWARVDRMSEDERADLMAACLNVSPINCSWSAYQVANLLYHYSAQGIEAGTAATPQSDAVHESAASEAGDASTVEVRP